LKLKLTLKRNGKPIAEAPFDATTSEEFASGAKAAIDEIKKHLNGFSITDDGVVLSFDKA
jgi:hypothetical protein